MAQNKENLSLQEILDILEEDDDPATIFITPPEVKEDSDEDSGDEDGSGLADNLNSSQLRAPAEAVFPDGRILDGILETKATVDEENENMNDESTERQVAARKKRKISQKMSLEYDWKRSSNIRLSVHQPLYEKPPPAKDLKGKSPVEKFEYFFDDEIMNLIARESCRYACEKNVTFTISVSELRVVFGILILSGYHTLPSRRLYWSLDDDASVNLVANAISRDRFEEILRFLHFTDNQALNKEDKLAKLRPLMDHLNKKFALAYPMDQHLALDEAMIEYYGRHGCKQCIRNKPVRFGFKAWCFNSPLGYLVNFDIYQGTSFGSNQNYEEVFGKGGGTLMILFDRLPGHIKDIPLRFYFDNYFTGLPLVNHLREMNYGATGTIRDSRIPKSCPIKLTSEMKKAQGGAKDIVVDSMHKILMVRWKDNAVVTVVSNISSVYPLENVTRWSAKDKKKITVSQPNLIRDYNIHMGGTDRMDQNVNCYRISIRKKKWWWPIFSWMIDETIQDSWLLHRIEEKDIPLLEFKRYIARTYLQQAEQRRVGRPKVSSRVIQDVRYDNIGHLVKPSGKQAWKCALTTCKSRPSQGCVKCGVPLCVKCFVEYHTNNS